LGCVEHLSVLLREQDTGKAECLLAHFGSLAGAELTRMLGISTSPLCFGEGDQQSSCFSPVIRHPLSWWRFS
jgi:hypothetical protein